MAPAKTILGRGDVSPERWEAINLRVAVVRLLQLLDQLSPRLPGDLAEDALSTMHHAYYWAGVGKDIWAPWITPAEITAVENHQEPQ